MNRREFLKGIAALAVSLILPKVSGSGYITLPSVARIHVNSGDEKIEAHHGKSFELTCGDGTKMGRDENGDYIVPDGAARKMREWLGNNTRCPLEISMQYGQCEPIPEPPPVPRVPKTKYMYAVSNANDQYWYSDDGCETWEEIDKDTWSEFLQKSAQDWVYADDGSLYEIQNKESDT